MKLPGFMRVIANINLVLHLINLCVNLCFAFPVETTKAKSHEAVVGLGSLGSLPQQGIQDGEMVHAMREPSPGYLYRLLSRRRRWDFSNGCHCHVCTVSFCLSSSKPLQILITIRLIGQPVPISIFKFTKTISFASAAIALARAKSHNLSRLVLKVLIIWKDINLFFSQSVFLFHNDGQIEILSSHTHTHTLLIHFLLCSHKWPGDRLLF